MNVVFFVDAIIMAGIMFTSLYIFIKAIQYKLNRSQIFFCAVWCLSWAVIRGFTSFMIAIPLACFTTIFFVYFVTKQKLETSISAILISYSISWVVNFIASILISFPVMFFVEEHIAEPLNLNNPIYILLYTLIILLQLFLAFLIFRIRRFRKGFPFIFQKYTLVIALIFAGAILILINIVNSLAGAEDEFLIRHFSYAFGVIAIGIGIFILIKKLIVNHQKKRMRQHTEEQYKKMLAEAKLRYDELNKKYHLLNQATSVLVHNFEDRMKSMEKAAAQNRVTLDDIQHLRRDFETELDKYRDKKALPTTKVNSIDNLISYYARLLANDGIGFDFMIDGSVRYMVENVVSQGHLETLLVNHINDAQKAVQSSRNSYKQVTVMIRIKDGCYEVSFLDSGISFEVDTLVRLGTERVTTHSKTGGGGIGFETTFEMMRRLGASLIISENEESNIDFSKSITVRFDGMRQYIIKTHRASDFPSSDRYIVVDAQGY